LDNICLEYQIPYLRGIPGTIGAAAVQNAGAYGAEIADYLVSIKALDRQTGEVVKLTRSELQYEYRSSLLKKSIGYNGSYSPRWIVLAVELKPPEAGEGFPVTYPALASELGVPLGERLDFETVSSAILRIRGRKGMLAPNYSGDIGTCVNQRSCGSFFTNPVVDISAIEAQLPPDAPRYLVREDAGSGSAQSMGEQARARAGTGMDARRRAQAGTGSGEQAQSPSKVKLSAAWLVEHCGVPRNYSKHAAISPQHALAIINPSDAYSEVAGAHVRALASEIIMRVQEKFGVTLEAEPIVM
jgi:UDP-N-acetylmuramate dehydrogenase